MSLRNKGTRAMSDTVNKLIAVAMYAGCLILFAATAIYGVSFVSNLGGAGWFIYVVLIGTFAMVFGPVVASAHGFWERGSPRHRKKVQARYEEQSSKYRHDFIDHGDQAEDGDSGRES